MGESVDRSQRPFDEDMLRSLERLNSRVEILLVLVGMTFGVAVAGALLAIEATREFAKMLLGFVGMVGLGLVLAFLTRSVPRRS